MDGDGFGKNEETRKRKGFVRKLLLGERRTPFPLGSRRADDSIGQEALCQLMNGGDDAPLSPRRRNDLNQRGDDRAPTDKSARKLPSARPLVADALNS